MNERIEPIGATQRLLMRELLHARDGVTVDGLSSALRITRNAVRQHLATLERDGLVERGTTRPSGGRPLQCYVLTARGLEHFPRHYSWFSAMLLNALRAKFGEAGLAAQLADLGRDMAASVRARIPGGAPLARRLEAIAGIMAELGYDTTVPVEGQALITARNCVFHQLAAKSPEVCSLDLAFLSASSGCRVEHRSCMVRGSDACRFGFHEEARPPAPDEAQAPSDA